mmetsp:Transcript_159748/g.512593  ORF Transcript_159748/g.512593 Transcript_159748/m.512593 type:complete len:202 (-) Transcript_159748:8796-9401(-)
MWNLTEHCDGFRLMRGLSKKPTDCTEDAVAFLLLVRNNVGLPISEAVSRAFGLAHLVVGLPPFSKAASLPSCRPADCFGEAVAFLLLDRATATGLPSSEADVRERRDETDGLRTTWKTSPPAAAASKFATGSSLTVTTTAPSDRPSGKLCAFLPALCVACILTKRFKVLVLTRTVLWPMPLQVPSGSTAPWPLNVSTSPLK